MDGSIFLDFQAQKLMKSCTYLCKMPRFGIAFWLFLFIFSAFICPRYVLGQLRVDANMPLEEAISNLVGQGVKVTNIRVNCPSTKGRPFGYFTDNTGTLGISDGLVITTGSARNAIGPNNSANVSQGNNNEFQDPDLGTLVRRGEKQFDACIIEFDVEVFSDTLSFDYVFGSEEYLEFIKEYHDVFGFFISGPGISGKRNLARLPGTQTSISVANVNNSANSAYYIDNGTGSTPFENLFVQYDGFTRRLEAKVAVIPCQVYRLKLAICDVKDDQYDAGIFIAGKSLKTKAPQLSYRLEHPKFPTAIEGCNSAYVKVKRQSRLQEAITFGLRYSGSAFRDIDFGPVPDSIAFLPGEVEKEFFVSVFQDAETEIFEEIEIELLNPCPGLPQVDLLRLPIKETFEFSLPDARVCFGDSVLLNPNPASGYSHSWAPPDYLSCNFCDQPFAFPPQTSFYSCIVKDEASGCSASDSLQVLVDPLPVASFITEERIDYTSLDVYFNNTSQNADAYSWDFGDGTGSSELSPLHYYFASLGTDSVNFLVVLKARNQALGCEDTATARVSISNPLFIPNLITPNEDNQNDAFWVKGIQPGIWRFEVFNRWGKRVFEDGAYRLDWKGEGLSPGVYFFVLSNPNGDRVYKSWVKIQG
jgi:hypothetical protein